MRRRSTFGVSAPPSGCRRATLRDLDAIVALELGCFGIADAFPRRVWRHLLGPAARRGTAITLIHEDPLVTDAARRVPCAVATGLVRRGSRIVRLYSVAVDPAQRGKGLGRKMIAALIAAAPRSCDTLSLEVRADNGPARALYESMGMSVVGNLPDYYPDGADGFRYRGLFKDLVLR